MTSINELLDFDFLYIVIDFSFLLCEICIGDLLWMLNHGSDFLKPSLFSASIIYSWVEKYKSVGSLMEENYLPTLFDEMDNYLLT